MNIGCPAGPTASRFALAPGGNPVDDCPMNQASSQLPAHPFWAFSLAVYGRDGVAPALLALQDRDGLQVNLLLYSVWAASQPAGRLDEATLAAAQARVANWQQQMVQPLRELRRQAGRGLPCSPPPYSRHMKQALLAAELEAEHIEQLLLAGESSAGAPLPPRLADAAANLLACLRVSGVALKDATRADLATLLQGCCPDHPPDEIDRALGGSG